MSSRDAPAHADADPCTKPCLCHECEPELTATQRQAAGYFLARTCGCFVCGERVRRVITGP